MISLFKSKKKQVVTEEDRLQAWAFHNCERENAKWLGTDWDNICPLRGNCPRCRQGAIAAIRGAEG